MKQVLSIAGYDSNGSAGLAADLHSFYADGVYGQGVLTAAVAENATHITASHSLPLAFISEEFSDLAEFNISATKTGMIGSADVIKLVIERYNKESFGPLVVDPVIITKRHDRLLDDDAFNIFTKSLIPLATVITPNFFEAEELVGMSFNSSEDIKQAAHKLTRLGAKNVVIKGKHQNSQTTPVKDFILLSSGESFWITNPIIHTNKINGSGDSFSAIITTELAKGTPVKNAIIRANQFVRAALESPLNIGSHFGPINHWAGQKKLKS